MEKKLDINRCRQFVYNLFSTAEHLNGLLASLQGDAGTGLPSPLVTKAVKLLYYHRVTCVMESAIQEIAHIGDMSPNTLFPESAESPIAVSHVDPSDPAEISGNSTVNNQNPH